MSNDVNGLCPPIFFCLPVRQKQHWDEFDGYDHYKDGEKDRNQPLDRP